MEIGDKIQVKAKRLSDLRHFIIGANDPMYEWKSYKRSPNLHQIIDDKKIEYTIIRIGKVCKDF